MFVEEDFGFRMFLLSSCQTTNPVFLLWRSWSLHLTRGFNCFWFPSWHQTSPRTHWWPQQFVTLWFAHVVCRQTAVFSLLFSSVLDLQRFLHDSTDAVCLLTFPQAAGGCTFNKYSIILCRNKTEWNPKQTFEDAARSWITGESLWCAVWLSESNVLIYLNQRAASSAWSSPMSQYFSWLLNLF